MSEQSLEDGDEVEDELRRDPQDPEDWKHYAPIWGCCSGGCVIPFLLLLCSAIVYRDIPGILFWPLSAIPLGLFGLFVGMVIRETKKRP